MKKIYLYMLMAMTLALTACGTDKNNETPAEPETSAYEDDEPVAQPQAEQAFELTEQGKTFLEQMCKTLNDFDSRTIKDEAFWRDFLFYSYTGASWKDFLIYSYTGASEDAETEQIYREDLGFDETVVKISLEEAEYYTKLVFGIDLPEIKPSFEDMEEGQTSCYYQDGYYYIGVSDFPDRQYRFMDYEESGDSVIVRYTIDFEGESDVGMVSFTVVPEANENGFIVVSKTTEFFRG